VIRCELGEVVEMSGRGWFLTVIVVLLLVALVGIARGPKYHRGPLQVGPKDVGVTTIVVPTPAA
jgi:hypothetical protein